ncbi:MAG: DUF3300 domain-containing protein [Smithellaceae bacterium]
MMAEKYMKIVRIAVALAFFLWPALLTAQTDIDVRYESENKISDEELAQMLAPIALYPDPLLSQILIASAYPFEVAEAERWVSRNPHLSGEAMNLALEEKDWDVSVLALCHYPKVLTLMAENLSWTATLGDAFVNQEEDVMVTVQELRARANDAGNLATTSEQQVIVEQRIIRIEPISDDYIYVPVYDPLVVYGRWWLPLPPFAFFYPGVVVTGPGIIFSPGIYVRYGYVGWSRFDWRDRRTVIVRVDQGRRYPRRIEVNRYESPMKWTPDRDRRYTHERRAREIPRYRPQASPQRRIQEPALRKGGEAMKPSRTVPEVTKPRITDRNQRPEKPQIRNQNKTPSPSAPRVNDLNKTKRPARPVIEPNKRSGRDMPQAAPQGPERNRPALNGIGGVRPAPDEGQNSRPKRLVPVPDERPDRTRPDRK